MGRSDSAVMVLAAGVRRKELLEGWEIRSLLELRIHCLVGVRWRRVMVSRRWGRRGQGHGDAMEGSACQRKV